MLYKIALAGTTANTVTCAQALFDHPDFVIPYIITPSPKKIGRKQIITKNPLHLWAEAHQIPCIFVEKKINQDLFSEIICLENDLFSKYEAQIKEPAKTLIDVADLKSKFLDFLLIVDFGYYIPSFLLNWPKIAPLNIHPSLLPQYRGSSPAQFTLLNGEKESAVSLMIPNAKMDEGDLITQLPMKIDFDWDQKDFYLAAFALITNQLGGQIGDFARGKIPPTPQSTPPHLIPAPQITKNNTFLDWNILSKILNTRQINSILPSNSNQKAISKNSKNSSIDQITPAQIPLSIIEKQILQKLSLDQNIKSRTQLNHFLDKVPNINLKSQNLNQENIDSYPYNFHELTAFITDRAIKAFAGWPEVWTLISTDGINYLRVKIISSDYDFEKKEIALREIKIEGKSQQSIAP